MNKAELIKAVSSGADISSADAARAVDSVFGAITETLQSGSDVRLAFAVVLPTERPNRTTRVLPKLGEPDTSCASEALPRRSRSAQQAA